MPRKQGGRSAEVEWLLLNEKEPGLYHRGPVKGDGEGKKFRKIVVVPQRFQSKDESEEPQLSVLIHEINECEVFYILRRLGEGAAVLNLGKRAHGDRRQILLHYLKKHFPALVKKTQLSKTDKIIITHIISPYGDGMCFMPKRECRARWSNERKRKRRKHHGRRT
jgi:hypothetical protein